MSVDIKKNFDALKKSLEGNERVLGSVAKATSKTMISLNWREGQQLQFTGAGIAYFYVDKAQNFCSYLLPITGEAVSKDAIAEIDKIMNGADGIQFRNSGNVLITNLPDSTGKSNKFVTLSMIARYQILDAVNPKTWESVERPDLTGELVEEWKACKESDTEMAFMERVLNKFADKTFKVKRTQSYYTLTDEGKGIKSTSKPQFVLVK